MTSHNAIATPSFLPTTAPQDLADEMLNAVTRAERAEAALDLTQTDLRYARRDRDDAIARAKSADRTLDEIRTFHDTWGTNEDADQLTLWEDLGRILNGPNPPPCPECSNGKHPNCTGVVPDGEDYDHLINCPCATAGHEATR